MLFEDMRERFEELKKHCEEQAKTLALRDEIIMDLKTREKPCVMKMSNEDTFVSKQRKGATGPTNECGVSGCDLTDVDLIRCGLCGTLVCEECSSVKISKLRPIMNQCKTLYFACPECDVQISNKTTVNAYDLLKEKVQSLSVDLQNCKTAKEKIQQQQEGGDA